MVEIIPVQEERLRLEQHGYKRNGLGVLCPNMRVRSWYVQRYCVQDESGTISPPLTRNEARKLAKTLERRNA